MAEHAIKIKEVYFKAVLSGKKTFEIRKNDRNYQVGDIIHFVPVDDECGMIIPHDPNAYKITYVFHGGEYGLEEGYCVFGITPEAHEKEIRAKIIDKFAERLKSDEFQKYNLDMVFETSRDLSYSHCINAFCEYIDEIAERLKGVQNGRFD